MNPLSLIPSWAWAALVAVLAATSIHLKLDNSDLTLKVANHATRIAELREGISAANVTAAQTALSYQSAANEAVAAARVRERTLAADASNARTELDRLRVAVKERSFGLRADPNTFATNVDYTGSFPELFLSCTEKYVELARLADGHANDVQALIEAWPASKL